MQRRPARNGARGRSAASLRLLLLAVAGAAVAGGGCSSREKLHPALQLQDRDIEWGTKRGQWVVKSQAPASDVYAERLQDVNVRVSPEVVLRSAGCCWPADEVAFQIAQENDVSDAAIRRAVRRAMKAVERELKFVAVVQIPEARDPASIGFLLRTNTGVEYPPLAVEAPTFLREVKPLFEPTAPLSAMYYYVVRFPIQGGPGIPPVGPNVSSLALVVTDGENEGPVTFQLPRPWQ